jgi:hypothetical protein
MRLHPFPACAIASLIWAIPASASVLSYFSFNNSLTQPTINSLAGTSTVTQSGTDSVAGGQAGVAFTLPDGQVYPAGKSLAFNSGVNDGSNAIEFTFNPSASRHLVLSYDYRSTSVSPTGGSYGPEGQELYYAIGGADPNSVLGSESFMRDSQWHRSTWSLSALIPDLSAVASVRIMLVPAPGAGTGTLGYDNLLLAGDAAAPGDVNGDGAVNFHDLLILAQNYGGTGTVADGDLNRDGRIDFADLLIFAQNFGTAANPAAQSVPEPAALTFLFVIMTRLARPRGCNRRTA